MEAREFYNKRLKEDPTIGTIQLMQEYAALKVEEEKETIREFLIGVIC